MTRQEAVVHDRMLLGAIDSFLKELAHVRPFRLARYEPALTDLAERWLADGGENQLAALDGAWLRAYLAQVPQDGALEPALVDFYRWAIQAGLVERSPLSYPSALC